MYATIRSGFPIPDSTKIPIIGERPKGRFYFVIQISYIEIIIISQTKKGEKENGN